MGLKLRRTTKCMHEDAFQMYLNKANNQSTIIAVTKMHVFMIIAIAYWLGYQTRKCLQQFK